MEGFLHWLGAAAIKFAILTGLASPVIGTEVAGPPPQDASNARMARPAPLGWAGGPASQGGGSVSRPASEPVQIYVSYADTLRAAAKNFPTPWQGSPNTTFEGQCSAPNCDFDAGAVRIVNTSGGSLTISAVAVHVGGCTFAGWPATTLAAGTELILTQIPSGSATTCPPTGNHMDTSDVGPGGVTPPAACSPDGVQPAVDVTINGTMTAHTDSGQVLNGGGIDPAVCHPASPNESTQWSLIGTGPCSGSELSLLPPSQTQPVTGQATVTALFTNTCNPPQPLSDTEVHFKVMSGPNAGLTATATTDANGQASFTYPGTVVGLDTVNASVVNLAGSIPSANTVTVNWTVNFAPGGGAFVIGDKQSLAAGQPAYFWGAQWWKIDQLKGGVAPASFKGLELSDSAPRCGDHWTTRPGNSPHPPATVPATMAVIVSDHITKSGSTISGDVVAIVLISTKPGYGPNPGHAGTGTIIRVLCS